LTPTEATSDCLHPNFLPPENLQESKEINIGARLFWQTFSGKCVIKWY
jgi:hypothetical protein